MLGCDVSPAFLMKVTDPRLFLFLSVWVLLLGVGLLALAVWLAFKGPEEIKLHPYLRRFKDSDWAQYLAGGIAFTCWSVMGIVISYGGDERELGGIETGLVRGLFIVSLLAVVALVAAKVRAKFHE